MSLSDIFRSKKRRNAGKVVAAAAMGGLPSPTDIAGLRTGLQKTCVITVRCGCCDEEWKDAVEPQKSMRLTCPHCGATNEITYNLNIVIVPRA